MSSARMSVTAMRLMEVGLRTVAAVKHHVSGGVKDEQASGCLPRGGHCPHAEQLQP